MNWTVYIQHISGIIQFLSFCDRFISLCVMLSRSIHVTNGRLFFKWQPTPVFLSGESHGQRSLVGYSSWGHKESDTTERLHFHFLFSILLHVYIAFPLSIYVSVDIWVFPRFTIVNNAAVKKGL